MNRIIFMFCLLFIVGKAQATVRGDVLLSCPKNVSLVINRYWDEAQAVERSLNIPMAVTLAHWIIISKKGKIQLDIAQEIFYLPLDVALFSDRYKKRLARVIRRCKLYLIEHAKQKMA